jgi:hypothetical protein
LSCREAADKGLTGGWQMVCHMLDAGRCLPVCLPARMPACLPAHPPAHTSVWAFTPAPQPARRMPRCVQKQQASLAELAAAGVCYGGRLAWKVDQPLPLHPLPGQRVAQLARPSSHHSFCCVPLRPTCSE